MHVKAGCFNGRVQRTTNSKCVPIGYYLRQGFNAFHRGQILPKCAVFAVLALSVFSNLHMLSSQKDSPFPAPDHTHCGHHLAHRRYIAPGKHSFSFEFC
jgi:hypothetical protein